MIIKDNLYILWKIDFFFLEGNQLKHTEHEQVKKKKKNTLTKMIIKYLRLLRCAYEE